MPITTSRMIDLLNAADDALRGLIEASNLITKAARRPLAPPELIELELMCQPTILMRDYARHLAIIEKEKAFYSPTRQGINRRAAAAQRRRRGAAPSNEGEHG